MSKNPISVETLNKLFICDAEAGKLFWRVRPVEFFQDGKQSAELACKMWNSRHAGTEAFTSTNTYGYLRGGIFGKDYLAHRVIWAMETGEWPVDQIDHEDHVRTNNRFGNLEEATTQENSKNKSISSNNTSGVTGVAWRKSRNKWCASIMVDRKSIHLGHFEHKDEAILARKTANIEYGFHRSHGATK